MKRINLCSGPRNVSTALMYSFAQRSDCRVVDEPLYAFYLKETGVNHPGRDEVLQAQSTDQHEVIREVLLGEYDRPVLFFKNMAHHMYIADRSYLEQMDHIFLIREPAEMITSFIKKIPEPTLDDTAYRQQADLFNDIIEMTGKAPAVIDSAELLKDPERVLAEACRQTAIDFDPAMLQWQEGPIPEDGVWASYWYSNVHKSTGFKPYEPKGEEVPDRLLDLLEQCRAYYEELVQYAIKA